ncbi:phage portal protein [Paenibacillus amylolyticus]|uniref:Phage portal protein n=1 Tax=Paenibacillus amylolyticus TaxID=1451 RepID=A0A1R1C5C7_PAEAM|nr:phage tail tube protein [Paenibacillus amylolyticus]OMF17247.1 phage portal protein [Paenibacillus amylolyticus]
MTFFKAEDAISGKLGTAFATIDGRVEELFYAKAIEATAEKNKVEVPILGKTANSQRSVGWSGTGTLTIYYVSPIFRRMMLDYVKTGKDTYFDMQITNEDPTSAAGAQTATLIGCNIDSVIVTKLDTSSDDMLEEEIPFTYNDFDYVDEFNQLT